MNIILSKNKEKKRNKKTESSVVECIFPMWDPELNPQYQNETKEKTHKPKNAITKKISGHL